MFPEAWMLEAAQRGQAGNQHDEAHHGGDSKQDGAGAREHAMLVLEEGNGSAPRAPAAWLNTS